MGFELGTSLFIYMHLDPGTKVGLCKVLMDTNTLLDGVFVDYVYKINYKINKYRLLGKHKIIVNEISK